VISGLGSGEGLEGLRRRREPSRKVVRRRDAEGSSWMFSVKTGVGNWYIRCVLEVEVVMARDFES
jgi:hypothetical protein